MAILKIDEVSTEGGVTQLVVEGEIDLDTVSTLRAKLEELKQRGACRLVLDFGETRYVNSSALAVLVKFAETFREQGGGIALARVSPRVKLVFEMLGLLVFFKFFDSVEAAKAAFPAGAQG
ncbi:MAG: anti-sigma factor antagonist [Planctomycetota bacterium]|nr:MAG: anti-sigma factor antagonist [Planctomycetota bacterium]